MHFLDPPNWRLGPTIFHSFLKVVVHDFLMVLDGFFTALYGFILGTSRGDGDLGLQKGRCRVIALGAHGAPTRRHGY